MQQLLRNIEYLLTDHDCVVVPQFGAFVVQHCAAEAADGFMLPPRDIVCFNASLKHDDALLSTFYVKTYNVRYPEAKAMISSAVAELNEKLNTAAVLSRMGELRKEDDRLVFEPSACSFLPFNYGWQQVALIKRAEQPTKVIRTDKDRVVISLPKRTLRYAAAAAIAFVLWAVPQQNNVGTYADYASLAPINYTALLQYREKLHHEQEVFAEEVADETVGNLVAAEPKKFHLIVASLERQAAERFVANLQTNGYEDATMIPYKNTNRVAISSYSTYREAVREMNKLRKQTDYKRAWVYCEK